MNTTLIIIGIAVLAAIIAFFAGYFIKKNKVTEEAGEAIKDSEVEDKDRDKVVKEAREEMKKNEEAIKRAEDILSDSSD